MTPKRKIDRHSRGRFVAVTVASVVFCTLTLGGWLRPLELSEAVAHEQKVAITQVLFNPNTGNIEIAHRLYLHDAEHAVQEQWGAANLYDSPEDLEKLALYVRGNFFLRADDTLLSPVPVGHEIDGPFVWVYDEVEIPEKRIETLMIDNTILRDVFRGQANLVNVEIGTFRESAFFAGEDGAKTIRIIAGRQ